MTDIRERIEEELKTARAVCESDGADSQNCAVAWDNVEELQAEASHQREEPKKNSLEAYCDDNPDAAECRVYDD
ncbi:CP12 domain protein [Rubidibacter lacunae KORDI 51-2]|uniref:CP12 domain protein n=1 Tax=Rubidibacter lacunae KORDI 51-2 TaxID=582515 RepID=U5DNT3_9CHRO|nr:Calvin cycle protein CP12 [Rubidibacter lacunae]ERN42522.1 CP12 domain protein [Rubidibacter lacunae KORDI 51-2]